MFGALATLQASSLSLLGTPRNFERLDCPRTFHCLKGWIARGQLLRPKSGGAPDTPTPQRKSRARRARDVGALRASGLAAEVALWSLPIFSPSVAFAPSARSSVEPSPCWGEDVPTFAFAKGRRFCSWSSVDDWLPEGSREPVDSETYDSDCAGETD